MDPSLVTVATVDPESVRGCFPYGFWREFWAQFSLAWPLSLSMLFHYLIQPISIAFCGHLGPTQLAAVAMAISVIYVVVVSIGRGLAFGGDTFFSQTYGSENKKNVGVYLQKGIIFAILWTMPVIGILLNTESLLLLMRQDPEVARLAQVYVTLFCPGVLAYCCLFMIMRYLLCQNKVLPILLICFVSCGVNTVLNYGLIYQADMGIRGSAISLAMTYYLVLILMLSYIWGMRIYTETWAGWSFACLEDWGEFFRVTSYSICMTFIFWLCTEVGTFLGGVLGPKDLSAFSISFQIEGFAWMIPLGIGGACTSRLGQFLGANKPRGAVNAARVALLTVMVVSVVMAAVTYALRFYIPLAFTTDKSLIDYTAAVLQLTSLFLLFEGFGGTGVGIVRATGKQAIGTLIVLVAYYAIAWPIGIPLMFATDLGLFGLWWGIDVGIIVEDVFLAIFVMFLNWEKEAQKAVERSEVGGSKTDPQTTGADPNERTRLLPGIPPINTTEEFRQSSLLPNTIDHSDLAALLEQPSYRRNIVLRRLGVAALFAAPLVAGVLTRVYVHVSPHWTTLCLPTGGNNTGGVTDTPIGTNSTLPYCVDQYAPLIQYPRFGIWI